MKIIKGLFTIILLCILIVSCKDSKKEEHPEAMEASEMNAEDPHTESEMKTEEKSEAVAEKKEMAGFSYAVNYPKDTDLAGEVDSTIKSLMANYPGMEADFANAYGFAVFPKITKAGLGIGGAGGKGLVLENGHVTGLSKLMQATLGFQAGGQQYTQAIFFENKEALDNFTNGKFKFSSEASAVALKSGVSANIVYHDGVATVIESEKGAMFEASLGTQKFKFDGEM